MHVDCSVQKSLGLEWMTRLVPFAATLADIPAKCQCAAGVDACTTGSCTGMPFQFDDNFHVYGSAPL